MRDRLLLLVLSLTLLERSRRLGSGLRDRDFKRDREHERECSRTLEGGGLRDSDGIRSRCLTAELRTASRRLITGLCVRSRFLGVPARECASESLSGEEELELDDDVLTLEDEERESVSELLCEVLLSDELLKN